MVEVGNVHLRCEILGESDPLVMIPGLATSGTAGHFRRIPVLAEHCRIVAIDKQGWQPASDKRFLKGEVEP